MEGELEGFKEYLDILNTLGNDKEMQKLLKATNKDSLKDIEGAMRTSLPFSKRLLSNVRIGATKVDGKTHPNAQAVGPTSDSYILRFLEKGTVERYTKEGASRGAIKARNAITPFLNTEGEKLQNKIPEIYGEKLVELTARKVKKINKK